MPATPAPTATSTPASASTPASTPASRSTAGSTSTSGSTPASAPVRAVLFDMDGTLADSEPTHGHSLRDVLGALALDEPEGFGDSVTGVSMQVLHERLVETMGLALTYPELAARKYAAFRGRAADIHPRPGSREALQLVRDAGLPFAVVSNSDRILIDITLSAIGLLEPDRISVSRNDVRRGKPDPEPYLRAAWLLDVPPEHCLVVEDSAPGATAGLAAGMRVIAWPEPHRRDIVYPAGCIVADPDDLAATLRACIVPAA